MSVVLSGTAKYTGDSGSDIDNVTQGGFVAIVQPTTASLGANQCMIIKGSGGANPSLQLDNTGALTIVVSRATTNLLASAPLTNFPSCGPNVWLMVAGRFSVSGSNSNQQLWAARLGQALREPSSYTSQQVGSGAQVDDSAATLFVGNTSGGARPVTCPLFAVAMFNSYPNYTALMRTARELLVIGRNPILTNSVARAYRFDRGTGTVVGLKSQQAITPSGTINLAKDPVRILAGGLRVAPGVDLAFPPAPAPVSGSSVAVLDRARRAMATRFLLENLGVR